MTEVVVYGEIHQSDAKLIKKVTKALKDAGMKFVNCRTDVIQLMEFNELIFNGTITPYDFSDVLKHSGDPIQLVFNLTDQSKYNGLDMEVGGLEEFDVDEYDWIQNVIEHGCGDMADDLADFRLMIAFIGVDPSKEVLDLFKNGTIVCEDFDGDLKLFTPKAWSKLVANDDKFHKRLSKINFQSTISFGDDS